MCLTVLTPLTAQLPAFPGAEGGGMYTVGGRGGKVLEVTSLADGNEVGTFRWAVSQTGARTVVFRVSGTITLNSSLRINKDSITIAGQTAPGGGICIRKYPLLVEANHVIVRHLRVRLGDESGGEDDALSAYTNGGTPRRNIIIDHCSASWSVDETFTAYGNDSVTVQWCIISESLRYATHAKGPHGYGGIWGGHDRSTFHHNLFAHHTNRTPRISGGLPFRSNGTVPSHNVDIRNNVIYNSGSSNSVYGGEAGSGNIVGNYYKRGPASQSTIRVFRSDDSLHFSPRGQWFIDGNRLDGFTNTDVNIDNWLGVAVLDSRLTKDSIKASSPFPYLPVTTQTAEEAYASVLFAAGAAPMKRDAADARIVHETATGTAPNGAGLNGIIDGQAEVGGWPELSSIPAPTDTDNDGMSDEWEIAHALNPNDDSDRNVLHGTGYTWLEVYLDALHMETVGVENAEEVPGEFGLSHNYPNPFNPETVIWYRVLGTGSTVRLSVFDLLGREVAILVDHAHSPGSYSTTWKASAFPSGVYIARLSEGQHVTSIRMVLAK